jgi:hypothetical protein
MLELSLPKFCFKVGKQKGNRSSANATYVIAISEGPFSYAINSKLYKLISGIVVLLTNSLCISASILTALDLRCQPHAYEAASHQQNEKIPTRPISGLIHPTLSYPSNPTPQLIHIIPTYPLPYLITLLYSSNIVI